MMHQAKLEVGGFSTSGHAPGMTSSGLRSPGDGVQSPSKSRDGHISQQSGDNKFVDSVPIKRGQQYFELQRSDFEHNPDSSQNPFRSTSQEELDALLEGLDRLTETLPDLSDVRPYSVLSRSTETTDTKVNNLSAADVYGRKTEHFFGKADQQASLIRPSLVASTSHSSGFQSRDNYQPEPSSVTSSAMSSVSLAPTAQPYHTRTDSKPFSYIRTSSSRGPSRNLSRASSREGLSQPGLESPGLLRKIMGGGDSDSGSRPMSPALSYGGLQRRDLDHLNGSNGVSPGYSYSVSKSPVLSQQQQQQQQNSSLIKDAKHLSAEEASLTWLQRQQMKLQERRDAQRRRIMSGGTVSSTEQDLMSELKTSLHRARSEMDNLQMADGYMSDTTSFRFSETSRESSPHKYGIAPSRPPQPVSTSTPKWQQEETYSKRQQHEDIYSKRVQQQQQQQQNDLYSKRLQQQQQQQQQQNDLYSKRLQQQEDIYNKRQLEDTYSKLQQQSLSLQRQRSDTSFDRARPLISRRLKYDTELEESNNSMRFLSVGSNGAFTKALVNGLQASNHSLDSFQACGSLPDSRPITPGFPNLPSTPSFTPASTRNGGHVQQQHYRQLATPVNGQGRAASPSGSMYQTATTSRRGSVSSEPADVPAQSVKLVKDSHKFWYKPHISREDAIGLLRHRQPGAFVVRDSNSFPGAFGLALKVASPPLRCPCPTRRQ